MQHALADFMREAPEFAEGQAVFYQARRDRFAALLRSSRFLLRPVQGTYFMLADYSAVSELPDTAFCEELTRRHGVAAIPLSPFCDQAPAARLVRFCFAKEDRTLEAAAAKLCAVQAVH
jgi:methionine aminotransferase